MTFSRARVLAIAASVGLLAGTTALAADLPIAAYGQLPSVSHIALSPDGKSIAVMVGDETGRELQLRTLPDRALITAFQAGRTKVRSLDWAGSDHLLMTLSTTARATGLSGGPEEWFMLSDYDLKEKRWTKLLQNVEDAMNVVIGSPVVLSDGKRPAIVVEGLTVPGNVTTSTLFHIDLDSHRATPRDVGTLQTADWLVGADGRAVARVDYRQAEGKWRLLVRTTGSRNWKTAHEADAPFDRPQLLGYGKDTGTLLVSKLEDESWQTHAVSLADASWSPPVTDLDSDTVVRDRATRTVIGSRTTGIAGHDYQFLAASDQNLWAALKKAFPGEIVSLVDWSDDRMTVVVEVEGKTNGDAFFVIDRVTHKADWLANRYRDIDSTTIAEQRVISYKAADGLEIPAYLTLPRGRPAKGLPLVVLPHGGPADRDAPGFDWWSQALASRGYAVLQPQFRGSDGFGTAHLAAGHGQWGRKMQSDLSDGVRHLASEGIVDARRACIVGASYGGYAALAGVALESGVYRCAVAVAGVSDLRRMLRSEAAGYFGARSGRVRYWKRFMGAESVGDTAIDAWSPALHADAVKAPVLLIHGKDDTVVPFEQSRVMADAMKRAGGNVELVTLAAEDHWLSRGPTRVQMLEATVGFLEKHNPAK
ncbi:MAG: peptidase S9 [Alphaproteobacteria bacterium]|nr:MAG: peptidase S9 [Alphaproteobacteria bacterium]